MFSYSFLTERLSRLVAIGLAHVLALAAYAVYKAWVPYTPPEITPLKAPLMKELPEYDYHYKSNMLWGTYRSGLYFGMRTRYPPGTSIGRQHLLCSLIVAPPAMWPVATCQQQCIVAVSAVGISQLWFLLGVSRSSATPEVMGNHALSQGASGRALRSSGNQPYGDFSALTPGLPCQQDLPPPVAWHDVV